MNDFPYGRETEFEVGAVEEKKRGTSQKSGRVWVILKLGLIAPNGAKQWAEMFAGEDEASWPKVGSKIVLNVSPAEREDWLPKVERPGRGGGGGVPRGRSPADTAAIQRQHSQEMGLRWAAILAAAGRLDGGFGIEQLRSYIDWFEADIDPGKRGGTEVIEGASDVPADTSGLEGSDDLERVPF